MTRRIASAVAAVTVIAAFAGWTLTRRPAVEPAPAARFDIVPPASQTLDFGSAVSPDGRRIVHVASGAQAQFPVMASGF